MSSLTAIGATDLVDLAPLVRRAVSLDAASLVRLRVQPDSASALVRLPFGVLVGRRIPGRFDTIHDGAYATSDLLRWLDGEAELPLDRAAAWQVGLPPDAGWRRVERIPDEVVRDLVQAGAITLKDTAGREGVPGAQPRAEVADALLDSIVITADDAANKVEVSLRQLSAAVRMGFLARSSHLAIDVAGRWLRLAAAYGSVYAERPGQGLTMVRRG